jgi:sulfide:quinone oxidoreductase
VTVDPQVSAHHQVVVVGGGNAGLSVAGRLHRNGVHDVVVIEPRSHHLYQPLFSHVAGGTAPASLAKRPQAEVMPHGVGLIQDKVTEVVPESSTVILSSGDRITYEHLIVCPGVRNDWDTIPGLAEAIKTPRVASNYEFDLARKASTLLRTTRSGTVVFTQAPEPASFAGAIQKPMYLACDYWRATGVLDDIRVVLAVPTPKIFGIDAIDEELERKIAEYGIEVRYSTELLEVDAAAQTVRIGGPDAEHPETLAYDVLIAEPPQSAPEWVKVSDLPVPGDAGGFVDVDSQTLRHVRFPNVWSLGDVAATPNAKSGGALRKQTLTVAKNIVAVLAGKGLTHAYNGYSVAPFTVSRSTVVFAEFDVDNNQKPTVPGWKNLARERRLTWVLDRRILPWVYWHMIIKGRA